MKTKDRKTQCLNENRLIVPRFRHLRRIERYLAENCCFEATICRVHSVFQLFCAAARNPLAKLVPATTRMPRGIGFFHQMDRGGFGC
jgi:hypothetical protein